MRASVRRSAVGLAALVVTGAFAVAVYGAYGQFTATLVESCAGKVTSENGAFEGATYWIAHHECPEGVSHIVAVKLNDSSAGTLAFTSVGSPVPKEIRQIDSRKFEIVLEAPLEDGTDRLSFWVGADLKAKPRRYSFRGGKMQNTD